MEKRDWFIPKPHWTTEGFPKRNVAVMTICIGGILGDTVGFITLGFIHPSVGLWVAKRFARRNWL